MTQRVVIVGGGHAGAHAAASLRRVGFVGEIALLSDEQHPPYERPPLSKDYLADEKPFERMMLRPDAFWDAQNIKLHLNHRVMTIDASAKTVCGEGFSFNFDHLIWAAGGAARRLPIKGGDAPNVFVVREKNEVDLCAARMADAQHVLVIGGGYIGLETAAIARQKGKMVTLVEAQERLLARVTGEALSNFYLEQHRAQGVDVRLSNSVDGFEIIDGDVAHAQLSDGTKIRTDLVIVGIGIIPNVAPLEAAGALIGNGVIVDEFCQTSLADIYAIGDCAAHKNRFADGAEIRLESVQNANDQAMCVAKKINGAPTPYDSVPWFWSTQFDLKLQSVGLNQGADQTVLRQKDGEKSFTIAYLRGQKLMAVDCVNDALDFAHARRVIGAHAQMDLEKLRDPANLLSACVIK